METTTETEENPRKRKHHSMTDGDENLTRGGLPGGDYTMAKSCVPSTSGAPSVEPPPYAETEMSTGVVQHSHQNELLPSYKDATRQSAAAENCDTDTPSLPAFMESTSVIGPSASQSAQMNQVTPTGPPIDENNHRYVGLVNQAMTCYLNSLIQTLYMTPEFRNAMYRWEYSGKDVDKSIPYQIQKLFLLLQTTDKDSLETKDLTSSFGWQSSEAYDQHDVQELCRLMFDALEHRWKATDHEKLIQDLYRGSMEDFVKCFACRKENTRKDYFLDLPLAVREFGATQAFHSVEEALSAFVKTEVLDGNNQYFCENCNAKQDAHKGLRITQFPKLLTIQLKRFDFDYNTMHRIKLNDRMTFPDVLNLNPFLGDNKPKFDDEKAQTVRAGESLDRKAVEELIEKEGEYVYELFSVMVHAGSAAGGHYFAYIKNMDQQSWYCFNDSRVDFCGPEDIMRSFGTSTITWSASNANAYMLMYRKICTNNEPFLRTENLPKHIIDLTAKWKRQEDEREEMLRYQASLVKVTVRLNYPGLPEHQIMNRLFQKEIQKTLTLSQLLDEAVAFFEPQLDPSMPMYKKNARLLKCNNSWNILAEFVARNQLTQTLEPHVPVGGYSPQLRTELNFLLDMKTPNASFYPLDFSPSNSSFNSYPKTYNVCCVDIVKENIASTFLMAIGQNDTAINVKKKLGGIFGVREHEFLKFRLWTEKRGYSDVSFAVPGINDVVSQSTITYMSDPGYLFIDGGTGHDSAVPELIEDRKKSMTESKMFAILERRKNSTRLYVELPTLEEIEKAQSLPMGFLHSGPTLETVQTIETPLSVGTAATDDPMSAVPSGRASSISSIDGDDMMAIDSLCNNTPQMSPNVSENGEGCLSGDESDVGRNGLNLLMKSWTAAPSSMLQGPPLTPPATETDTQAATIDESDSSSGTMVPWQVHRDQIIVDCEMDNKLQLDVDKRIAVAKFKTWIGKRIGMESMQFVLLKHHEENDSGYECGASSETNDTIDQAFKSANRISILLRPPLKDNEKLINVSLFSTEEIDREKWKPLFDIPASKETLVSAFLDDCRRHYLAQYGENLAWERLRIRCFDSNFKAMICLPNDATLERRGQQWLSKVYLQVIPEELVDLEGESIFVRHFKPSTMELGSLEEIIVNPAAWPDPVQATKETISKKSGIPADHIEFVEPTAWDKWPFSKPRLDLLEKSDWKSKLMMGDGCVTANHGKVLYYRDSKEEPKKLTPEERRQINIKDRAGVSQAPRRHERPLRINMNSVSEQ